MFIINQINYFYESLEDIIGNYIHILISFLIIE